MLCILNEECTHIMAIPQNREEKKSQFNFIQGISQFRVAKHKKLIQMAKFFTAIFTSLFNKKGKSNNDNQIFLIANLFVDKQKYLDFFSMAKKWYCFDDGL